ncbi:MAG TPA: hypothetical protein DCR48_02575 [Flavobacteriales bacterium]|nr:hypothetical protein [Flavobacteriales bacterium]
MRDKTQQQNTQELQKYFATVLRKRSKGEVKTESIDPSIIKFFTRKELINILTQKYDGKLPKEVNLIELENEDLLQLIEDELMILAYLLPKWIAEELEAQTQDKTSQSVSANSVQVDAKAEESKTAEASKTEKQKASDKSQAEKGGGTKK